MTVRELIAELSKYPSNLEVLAGEYYLNEFKVIDVQEVMEKESEPPHYVGLAHE